MIVCLCNRISDRAARKVACDRGCRTVGDIYRCLGCRVQCGKCVPEMRSILQDARARQQDHDRPRRDGETIKAA